VVTISELGRWPRAASIDYFNENAGGEIPRGILRSVTPGAPDAWLTALERFGTMTFERVVTPALELAEKGFPVSATVQSSMGTSSMWQSTAAVFMPNGRWRHTDGKD
jgi:gamma-glutamyltranspeptidase/glutathione hydrolase